MLPLNSSTAADLKFMRAFEIVSGVTEPPKMPRCVKKNTAAGVRVEHVGTGRRIFHQMRPALFLRGFLQRRANAFAALPEQPLRTCTQARKSAAVCDKGSCSLVPASIYFSLIDSEVFDVFFLSLFLAPSGSGAYESVISRRRR